MDHVIDLLIRSRRALRGAYLHAEETAAVFRYSVESEQLALRSRRLVLVQLEPADMISVAHTRHDSAAESARPAVLVIAPGFHPGFLPLVDAGVYAVEPVVGQILGDESSARVHKVSAETDTLHLAYLLTESVRIELVVPGPEGVSAVFGGRVTKFRYYVFHYFIPFDERYF